jgi:hypothetical protein
MEFSRSASDIIRDAVREIEMSGSERQAIIDVTYRYGLALDQKDWRLLRSVFGEAIEVDVSPGDGSGFRQYSGAEWANLVSGMIGGFDATQHIMTNHRVSINGRQARCNNYLHAMHILRAAEGEESWEVGGWYEWDMVNKGGDWVVSRYRLELAWQRGNLGLRKLARERAGANQ